MCIDKHRVVVYLPAEIAIVHMTNEQCLCGESIWLYFNIGSSNLELQHDENIQCYGNSSLETADCTVFPESKWTPHSDESGYKDGFALFNDTWSQKGHSASCMTLFFLNLQITRSAIRVRIKWAVSLVIDHLNLPRGFVWACMSYHTHFISPEVILVKQVILVKTCYFVTGIQEFYIDPLVSLLLHWDISCWIYNCLLRKKLECLMI